MEGTLTSSEIPHLNGKNSEDTEMVFCVSLGIMGGITPAEKKPYLSGQEAGRPACGLPWSPQQGRSWL